jgi:hypothetical protein
MGSPGAWVCIEELWAIDLLAVSSWSSPPNRPAGVRFPRVGYEVKVSRRDYRREVMRPHKRAGAVSRCHVFYFAVPAGLLRPAEIDFVEPADWDHTAFCRVACPGPAEGTVERWSKYHPVRCVRGSLHDGSGLEPRAVCPVCGGRGYERKARVELEAPTLWVPKDVGLIEVTPDGQTRIVRKAPVRRKPVDIPQHWIGHALRWVSVRPDPRHHGRSNEAYAAEPEDVAAVG